MHHEQIRLPFALLLFHYSSINLSKYYALLTFQEIHECLSQHFENAYQCSRAGNRAVSSITGD